MSILKKLGLFALFIWPQMLLADMLEVTLHYVGPTQGQAWLGVQQGLHEANLQGEFLGQSYRLEVVPAEELASTTVETALLLASEDEDFILNTAQADRFATVPVVNLISQSDALRAHCQSNLLHVTPSAQMRADALAQWQQRNPDKPVRVQSWHEDFYKFAARQLNNRFSKEQGADMDDDAWAGWASVKMIADTVVQTTQTDAAFMLDHLKHNLVFDGQKGDNTNFRENGQLRQLLLLVDPDNKIVAEAPLRGVEGGLDSLGHSHCQ